MVKQTQGESPVRHPYTAKHPVHWWGLRVADMILSLFFPRTSNSRVERPRRVLLASGGHLGDAVVLTASIRRVRDLLPEATIGVVLPSWSRTVVEGHPDVLRIHTIDHWRRNRARLSFATKLRQFLRTQHTALREIRNAGYDVAIDLSAYSPNMAIPLWRAAIPARAGFISGGFSPLFTHRLGWGRMGRHMVERHAELIRQVLGDSHDVAAMRYDLPSNSDAAARATTLLASLGLRADRYSVVHMGSGRADPHWSIEKWRSLAEMAGTSFGNLVFTGRGPAECRAVEQVTNGCGHCVNLCDVPDWPVFVELIRGSLCVFTVDTSAGHVAAAVDTPTLVVWPDVLDDVSWYPHGAHARVVSRRAEVAEVIAAMTSVVGRAGTPVIAHSP